jgi:catecholate siderophore receptor
MTQVSLSSYANATTRRDAFNQTDLTLSAATGRARQGLLVGAEIGRRVTDNFRRTGFFNHRSTSILVPFDNPRTDTP